MLQNHDVTRRYSHVEPDLGRIVQLDQGAESTLTADAAAWPLYICLLGSFRLLANGRVIRMRGDSKAAHVLGTLALRHGHPMDRETLLGLCWSESDAEIANEALRGMIRDLQKRVQGVLDGAKLVIAEGGQYRLNIEAGIGVDVARFDTLADAGDWEDRAGNGAAAARLYEQAIALYRGDLCIDIDAYAAVERERLRARYLALLARLAEHAFNAAEYAKSLAYAQRILGIDPCREDAHRLTMRCHVRRGERAQALRQYRSCISLLQAEFGVDPEPATMDLFEQVRKDPNSV